MADDEPRSDCDQCGEQAYGKKWCRWCTDVRETYNVDVNKPRLDVRLPLTELRLFVKAKGKRPAQTIRVFAELPDSEIRDVVVSIKVLKRALDLLCTKASLAQRGEIMLAFTAPSASGESSLVFAWTKGSRRGRYQLPSLNGSSPFGEVSTVMKGVFL